MTMWFLLWITYTVVVTLLALGLAMDRAGLEKAADHWRRQYFDRVEEQNRRQIPLTEHRTLAERPVGAWAHEDCAVCARYRKASWWQHLLLYRWKSVEKRWWA